LETLRHREKERVLWIDAICINQADVHENNRQISICPLYILGRRSFWYGWAVSARTWLTTILVVFSTTPPRCGNPLF
jgi:hypothetical protein